MSYRDILVAVDSSPFSTNTFGIAQQLCRLFNAKLTALYTIPLIPFTPAESAFSPQSLEQYRVAIEEMAEKTAGKFNTLAKQNLTTFDWLQCAGDYSENICTFGRHMDLNILSQPDSNTDSILGVQKSVQTLLGLGRPALLVPSSTSGTLSIKRVLAAWDGGVDAVRAINDALPLLQLAELVEVITVVEDYKTLTLSERSNRRVCQHLQNHAVNTCSTYLTSASSDTGLTLLNHAYKTDSDLLVVGAYAHGRAQFLHAGDVTQTLLQSMTVPVLFSH